jgi:hypothetical protein
LRLVALGASALVCFRGLAAAGLPWRDARAAVAWSYGGQVAALALSWTARAVLALTAL